MAVQAALARSSLVSGYFTAARRLVRNQPLGTVSALLLLMILGAAVFAEFISAYDPVAQIRSDMLKPPGAPYWFGTDNLGRDIFSRVLFGARTSLVIGLISVSIGTLAGSLIGIVSGYFGGATDLTIQRFMDSLMAFPTIILAMLTIAVLGPGFEKVILAVAIVQMPRVARVVRGSVLTVKEQVYVEAARTVGCTPARIMSFHVLPNVLAPIIVMATVTIGQAILIEASLSFLGLGPPPPTPSWGSMLSDAGRTFLLRAPWIATFPGLAITLTVLSFNLLGDSVRDVLDPRLREGR